MDSGGSMDFYWNEIYCIDNGKFVLLYEGKCGTLDNINVQYDSEGNPIYSYYWEGMPVSSREEYLNLLNEVFDTQKSVESYEDNSFCNYEEIIEAINKY